MSGVNSFVDAKCYVLTPFVDAKYQVFTSFVDVEYQVLTSFVDATDQEAGVEVAAVKSTNPRMVDVLLLL